MSDSTDKPDSKHEHKHTDEVLKQISAMVEHLQVIHSMVLEERPAHLS